MPETSVAGNETIAQQDREIVIIDLSSIAYPIWHTSASEPDPNRTSQQIVARVHALAGAHKHVAIACDSGRSFRKDLVESYKANRPPAEAMLGHQIDLACEQLKADGYPVWAVKGFEADDIIASAADHFLKQSPEDWSVLVVSSDKDLLQLVAPRVRVKSAKDGAIFDADAVAAKFGVRPEQMRDYLTLVGDSSDNIRGAQGIGPKKAAALLGSFGTLEGVYEALTNHPTRFQPAIATSLRAFQKDVDEVRTLVTLRMDVEVPFEQVFTERVPKAAEDFSTEFDPESDDAEIDLADAHEEPQASVRTAPQVVAGPEPRQPEKPAETSALAVREPDLVVPATYERGLDPRSMSEARRLALDMFQSRMFSAYGTPQAVLSTVMLGRELGLPAMASLRQVHVIEGRHALSAQLMVALVLKSGFAEYFEPIEFDDTKATFETHRKGSRNPVRLTHTIQMAEVAGLVKPNSNWVKVPTDMLVARAQSRLCRMVYPDIVGGLYTPEEIREFSNTERVA